MERNVGFNIFEYKNNILTMIETQDQTWVSGRCNSTAA